MAIVVSTGAAKSISAAASCVFWLWMPVKPIIDIIDAQAIFAATFR